MSPYPSITFQGEQEKEHSTLLYFTAAVLHVRGEGCVNNQSVQQSVSATVSPSAVAVSYSHSHSLWLWQGQGRWLSAFNILPQAFRGKKSGSCTWRNVSVALLYSHAAPYYDILWHAVTWLNMPYHTIPYCDILWHDLTYTIPYHTVTCCDIWETHYITSHR